MALIYFYDATDLDRSQLSHGLQDTDHRWEYVSDHVRLDTINPETEVLSVFVSSTVNREIIEALPKLRLIACRSTGFNNIDLDAAEERGITVVNVPTYGEATVAEYAFTLITALMRKLPQVLAAEYEDVAPDNLVGNDLEGKTIAVIGTGHIGQKAIRIAKGYGIHVIAYDPYPNEEVRQKLDFDYASLEDALACADIVTVHAPYLPSTHHLLNAERLGLLKPSAIVVNTARGEIIDTKALVELLGEQKIAGAALDVIEGEALLHLDEEVALLRRDTIPTELLRHSVAISTLKKMPNVIISPHNAFNTIEAIARINDTTTQNIIRYWYDDVPNKVTKPKTSMGKLLLVRHGESEWNATGQWSGTSDVHLDDKGFHEAALFGLKVRELGIQIDRAYCSEQIRTRETMEGILNASQQFDVDIIRSGAINERDYGDYTGKNKWDMEALLGKEAFDDLRRGWDVAVPNGETLKTVYERVVPFYLDTILSELKSGKNVLIVAHGNSIRALMKYIESISDEEVARLEMLFGQIVMYDVDDEGHASEKSIATIDTVPPHA